MQCSSNLNHTFKNKKNILNRKSKSISNKNKIIKNDNYLYDLIKTMDINLKMILDVTGMLKMGKNNKNLIIKRIKIINNLFEKYQSLRKEMKNIKTKNLVNNQICSEIKRRINENNKMYNNKINDFDTFIQKKNLYLKKTQKKFNEIQIYIRRESQYFYGYRKNFANFFIKPFIIENEIFVRYKKKLNEEIENKKNIINILNNEILEIKNKNKLKNNNINDNNNIIKKENEEDKDNNMKCNKLNIYLLSKEEEIKYFEKLNLYLINKKLIYEKTFTLSRKKFFKEIDMIKNDVNINIDLSQEISNDNDVSIIKKTNNTNEVLDSNVSNSILDLFTIQSNF